jgi:membrane-associated protease RseP (regulator of RpoE activity)
MNIVLAIVVLTVVMTGGADVPKYNTAPPVIGSVVVGSVAEKAGITPADLILSVNGLAVKTWDDLQMAVLPKAGRELTLLIDHSGSPRTVTVTPASETKYEFGTLGVGPVLRPQTSVRAGMPGEKAGSSARRRAVGRGQTGSRVSRRSRTSARTARFPFSSVLRDAETIDITVTPRRRGLHRWASISRRWYTAR